MSSPTEKTAAGGGVYRGVQRGTGQESTPSARPRAAEEIAQLLAARAGLRNIPPVLVELAQQGHRLLCPTTMSRIGVGAATCGLAAGAGERLALLAARPDFKDRVVVRHVGCLGACFGEPLVDVRTPDGRHYLFGRVGSHLHWPIIRTAQMGTLQKGAWLVMREREPGLLTGYEDLEVETVIDGNFAAFFEHQTRRVSGNCGLIDPTSLPEYVAAGGYFAFAKALLELSPSRVIAEVTASGLRGRGGGGFRTGHKWESAAAGADRQRIVIANGDEGDPGAYMDRTLLESDPHRVLEGIMLAAYAVGADQAHIFVRREYPLSVERLRRAIADARAAGLLGGNILGTDFSLRIGITQSAGAFVCGEETSLLRVMEGHRGEPAPRPPYPAQSGYRGHPTVINNVETLANVPWIIARGADDFRGAGNGDSPGTKIFCLTGDIPNAGFIEIPLGTGARTVVEGIGGAAPGNVNALQIGGPSGGIVPYDDFPLDFSAVASVGAMIGSGGLVVLDATRCLVDLVHHLVSFMAAESCGQCLLCRDGLATLEGMLARLTANRGTPDTIERMEELAHAIPDLSRCGLGRSAVNPLLTTLRHFRGDYAAHLDGVCPAASCKALIRLEIIPSLCTDCLGCYEACPVNAVKLHPGTRGAARYSFDDDLCVRCRICVEICPHGCIVAVPRGKP
ncbi:4Fe-4S dicluster domain-containing protein [Geobacter sp. FeAm09]|uniref:NADH-ubiquinone oxidoreductase-F iron-sulfur binding region domain-containing protein n=1 Tax=Geobacter sp. FeAm09 TaxID=2597769 RepID=UPI0011EDBD8D|nr:NADH-ubiquinone oxidoreductase-F iron-sulfur binding region domain-containing protein [Geobacter sp. FeAm09]QEM67044.1 4Fe-4S dicluster domain-containing protein [Geobacter sp. FeAm09]